MENEALYSGYNPDFLKDENILKKVLLPKIGESHAKNIAPVIGNKKGIIDYLNFSVVIAASRKLPLFTASNIDGSLFKKAARSTSWKKDERIKDYQWGQELYSAKKGAFDKTLHKSNSRCTSHQLANAATISEPPVSTPTR